MVLLPSETHLFLCIMWFKHGLSLWSVRNSVTANRNEACSLQGSTKEEKLMVSVDRLSHRIQVCICNDSTVLHPGRHVRSLCVNTL